MNFNKIMVVGCGGTGSYLISPLARFLFSQNYKGILMLVDGDRYEQSNVGRQEFPSGMVGQNKADAHRDICRGRFPEMVTISLPTYLGAHNLEAIDDGTMVISCVDNHHCRRLLSDKCKKLNTVWFLSSGNEMTDGNVQYYSKLDGLEIGRPIEETHEEIALNSNVDRSEMSCEQLSGLPSGGQVIFANMTSACILLQMFWNIWNGADNVPVEVFFDINTVALRAKRIQEFKPPFYRKDYFDRK